MRSNIKPVAIKIPKLEEITEVPVKKVKKKNPSSKIVLKKIKEILVSKKCEEIKIINLEKVNSYLSYFVLCTVNNEIQANAASKEIEKTLKAKKIGIGNTSKGSSNSGWILLDYGDILVHLMTKDMRSYYSLERLWGDAELVEDMA